MAEVVTGYSTLHKMPLSYSAWFTKCLVKEVSRYFLAIALPVRLHPFCTQRYLNDTVMPVVTRGLNKAGLARENFEICGGGFIATGADDESVAQAQ